VVHDDRYAHGSCIGYYYVFGSCVRLDMPGLLDDLWALIFKRKKGVKEMDRIIIGLFVGVITLVLAHFGYTLTSELGTEITNLIMTIVQAVGGLISIGLIIWGKIKAGREIKTLRLQVKRLGGSIAGDYLH